MQPALGTATASHSIFDCSVGLTDLYSNCDAYPHAYEGTHRYADGDVYAYAYKGAHRYADDDVYAHACRGAHYRRLH